MKNFKAEEVLQKFSDRLMNIILLGFFWFLCSLGIITVGASSVALSESMRRYLVFDEPKPLQVFFKKFKEYFKVSTFTWLIHLVCIAVGVWDVLYYRVGDTTMDIIAASIISVCLTLLVFEMDMVFMCIGYYDIQSIKEAFKKAMDLAFTCFIYSLEILFINLTVIVVAVFLFRGLLIFAAGLIAYLDWQLLPKMIEKYNVKRTDRMYLKDKREKEKSK